VAPTRQKELDGLRDAYKAAVDLWIATIREEEDLAKVDHSVVAVDVWENAGFREEEAREKAKTAKREYEDAIRKEIYNF
jgi:hypothetical protein